MRLVRRLLVATSLFSTWVTTGMADPRLDEWTKLPPDQSGLVLVIDAPLSSVTISGGDKKVISTTKWNPKSPFIRQFRVKPGYYTLNLRGPIANLGVVLEPGRLIYVQLAPYKGDGGDTGVVATVSAGGHPEFKQIGEILEKADQGWRISGVFATDFISPANNVLLVSTEPPWPIPPPPKR